MMTMMRDLFRAIVPVSVRRAVRDALGLPRVIHGNFAGLRPITGIPAEHVMIDVGAYEGWFTECWLISATTLGIGYLRECDMLFARLDSRIRMNRAGG